MIAPQMNRMLRNASYGRRQSRKHERSSHCTSRCRVFSYNELLRQKNIPVLNSKKVEREQEEYKDTFCQEEAERKANQLNPLPKKPRMIIVLISITGMIAATLLAPLLAALSFLNLEPKSIYISYALIVMLVSLIASSKVFKIKVVQYEEETVKVLQKRQNEKDHLYNRLLKEAKWLSYDLKEFSRQFKDQPVPAVHLQNARTIIEEIDSEAEINVDSFYEDPYIFAIFRTGEKIYFGHWE